MFTENKGLKMANTDRDFASKQWLRDLQQEDQFQLISRDAAVVIFVALMICSYMLFGGGVE